MSDQNECRQNQSGAVWVFWRLALILCLLLLLALSVFGLHALFDMPGEGVSITLSLLFGLPFSIGAIATFLNDPTGSNPRLSRFLLGPMFVVAVLVIGGAIIREGVICMMILTPLWLLSAAMGAWLVGSLQERFRERSKLNCSLLVSMPFLLLFAENYLPPQEQEFRVERAVVIQASADDVWHALSALNDIGDAEGKWNLTQNILRIPRPRSAFVVGERVGAVRYARWGENITFEEHISSWVDGRQMRWDFVFPNSSVEKYTDQHISPDGAHLKVVDGGYTVLPLGPSKTKLVLDTRYTARTHVNMYSSIWGELVLGDIQSNVLEIVRNRAESRQR